MNFDDEIRSYLPKNQQEEQDQKVIVSCLNLFPHNVLLRDNELAHLTSSGFIINKSLDKILMVHHNILNRWAWTGGHADGDSNLYEVACREAKEETGVTVQPISTEIASLDILTVPGHLKQGKYVNSHLHLSVAYVFIADEAAPIRIKSDENSAVQWLTIDQINTSLFDEDDVYLYNKLLQQGRGWWSEGKREI